MLRVRTIHASAAGAASRYYTGYLDPKSSGEVPGRWQGRQAHALGLAGAVSSEDLEALLSGRDPASGTRLGRPFVDRVTRTGKLIPAVAGFDATFSAPKSVSIWWALTGDPGVVDAHNTAVGAVLEHLERYGCTTRVRVDGPRSYPDAQGLTMAVFQQSTSREDDPQLHTHAVISSKVRAPNGGWYALDAHYLKNNQRALGALYQSVLRAELTHRYGVRWGPITEAQAEIADMPTELLEMFSKRTRQVDEYAELLVMAFRETEARDPTRWERAAIDRQAALGSRPTKTGLPVDEAAARWVDEAAEAGWTGHRLVKRICGHAPPERTRPDLGEVFDVASDGKSAWRRIDVLRALCDLTEVQPGFSGPAWARSLEIATDSIVDRHVHLDPHGDGGPVRASDGRSIWCDPDSRHLTHDGILAQEERIIAFALGAQPPEPRPSATVDVAGLDPLQADAARAVAGTDPLVLVVGPAGAGKTTTLQRAAGDLHRQRRLVFGVAPTAKAARVLETETGIAADTVAKLLHQWDRPTGPQHPWRLPVGTTLVVDETGMMGTAALDRLVALAQSQRWRLALVGDPHQLHAVGRGGVFDELCRITRAHHLATIHRFAHRWEQQATLDLRHGNTQALDAYQDHDRIRPGDLEHHLETIADAWIAHHHAGSRVAVTAETNAHVDVLNAAIQARRRDAGHLDDRHAVPVAGTETAGPGDIVVTRRNDRALRDDRGEPVHNRELWHVERTDPDGSLVVSRIRGRGTAVLPAGYARNHVRLGYAATAHGHQGDTVDISYTLIDPSTTHRGLYVGATRGRTANHLHVITDQPDLAEARDLLDYTLTHDRADIPATTQRHLLAETVRHAQPSLTEQAAASERRVQQAQRRAAPFEAAVRAAQKELDAAESRLAGLQEQSRAVRLGPRRNYDHAITEATAAFNRAREQHADAKDAAAPVQAQLREAIGDKTRLERLVRAERMQQRLDQLQQRARQHDALGL